MLQFPTDECVTTESELNISEWNVTKYTIVPIYIYSQHCNDNAFADSLTIIINSSHIYIFNYFIKDYNAKMFYVA